MPFELQHAGYLISDDPARLDPEAIHAYLTRSYWAGGIPRETVERSLQGSLCLGLYTTPSSPGPGAAPPGAQVGLARVITDYATFAWLCDVYVLEPHRGHGLSKALMRAVLAHPRLQKLRSFLLGTRDAHGLYTQFGFHALEEPSRYMVRRTPGVYQPVPPSSS